MRMRMRIRRRRAAVSGRMRERPGGGRGWSRIEKGRSDGDKVERIWVRERRVGRVFRR